MFRYVDGTFFTAPTMFQQVYSVHAAHVDLLVPCVFALLPGKSKEIYTEMFSMLMNVAKDRNFMCFKVNIQCSFCSFLPDMNSPTNFT